VFYTYEGAWETHDGFRLIGSGFYEGKPRSHRSCRYTPESLAAMDAAVSHAQAVLANAGATQAEIDAAADRLLAAIRNLVLR
jgi:hypothetical protein